MFVFLWYSVLVVPIAILLKHLISYFLLWRRVNSTFYGPPAIPFLGNVHQLPVERVAFALKLRDILLSYGKEHGIFRIWVGMRPIVAVCKPEFVEPILNSNVFIEKSLNYEMVKPWLREGLLLSNYVDIFFREAQRMILILEKELNVHDEIDIYDFVSRCTLDIICEAAMGVSVNAQGSPNSDYIKAVKRITEIIVTYEHAPWLWFKPIFHIFGYAAKYNACLKILHSFTSEVIRRRKKEFQNGSNDLSGDKRRLAFLDLLLSQQAEHGLSDTDIQEEVDTFMFEGHDTTTSGISFCLFLLGHHPEFQDKIVDEIDRIPGGLLNAKADTLRSQTPVLEAVIKEALRIFPSVPFFARNIFEDFNIGEYVIPKGCTALIGPPGCHLDSRFYGEDPLEFDPSRFLTKNNSRHPFSFIPFSAGPRNCIGQKFALLEEKVLIATIVKHYKVISIDDIETVVGVPDLVIRPAEKLRMRLIPRPQTI